MKKNMKGIELPVNVLVIIAIAVLVMLGMIALYVAGILPAGQINEFSSMTEACGQLKGGSPPCSTSTKTIDINWDADKNGNIDSSDSLFDYCTNWKSCDEYGYDEDDSGEIEENEITDASKEACCKAIVCGCTGLEKPRK